jgi:hypothetical protein
MKTPEEYRDELNDRMLLSSEALNLNRLKEKYSTECRRNGAVLLDFDVYKTHKKDARFNDITTSVIWFFDGLLIAFAICLSLGGVL